jgi:hypothetical protein
VRGKGTHGPNCLLYDAARIDRLRKGLVNAT